MKDKIQKAVMEAALAYYLEPYDTRSIDGIAGRIVRLLPDAHVSIDDSPEQIDTNEVRGIITTYHQDRGSYIANAWSYRIYPKIAGSILSGPEVEIGWLGN